MAPRAIAEPAHHPEDHARHRLPLEDQHERGERRERVGDGDTGEQQRGGVHPPASRREPHHEQHREDRPEEGAHRHAHRPGDEARAEDGERERGAQTRTRRDAEDVRVGERVLEAAPGRARLRARATRPRAPRGAPSAGAGPPPRRRRARSSRARRRIARWPQRRRRAERTRRRAPRLRRSRARARRPDP